MLRFIHNLFLASLFILGIAITESEHDLISLKLQNFFNCNPQFYGISRKFVFYDMLNGGDGCINLNDLMDAENKNFVLNFDKAISSLYNDVYYPLVNDESIDITTTDFFILAANLEFSLSSINPMQPPTKKLKDLAREFRYGRAEKSCDYTTCTADDGFTPTVLSEASASLYDCSEGREVFPNKGYGEVKAIAKDLKLSTKELVALMGSQIISSSQLERTRTRELVCPSETTDEGLYIPVFSFDNSYYFWLYGANLNRHQWMQQSSTETFLDYASTGDATLTRYYWSMWSTSNNEEVKMFNTDISLLNNIGVDSDGKVTCKGTDMAASTDNRYYSKCRTLSKTMLTTIKNYRDNHVVWMNDFSNAWKKLTEKQFKNLKKVSNVRKYDIIYPETIRDPEEEKKAQQKTNKITKLFDLMNSGMFN